MKLSEILDGNTIQNIFDILRDETLENASELYGRLTALLATHKEALFAKGVDYEELAQQIASQILAKAPSYKPGMRVRVHDGMGEKYLGEGTYEGNVTIYAMQMPDGSLRSFADAEKEPTLDMVPPEAELVCSEDNPKIRLDSGEIVYGCQVWWEEID